MKKLALIICLPLLFAGASSASSWDYDGYAISIQGGGFWGGYSNSNVTIRDVTGSMDVTGVNAELDNGWAAQIYYESYPDLDYGIRLTLGALNSDFKEKIGSQKAKEDFSVYYVSLGGLARREFEHFTPHLLFAIGAYHMSIDGNNTNLSATAPGVSLGAGLDYKISEAFFISAEAQYHYVEFEFGSIKVTGWDTLGVTTTVGLKWRF